jgi:hypothetical protein
MRYQILPLYLDKAISKVKIRLKPGLVVQDYNPSTQEAKAQGLQIQGQPGLQKGGEGHKSCK